MNKYTWNNSENDLIWEKDCFSTIEECIENAKNYGYQTGDTIK